MQAVPLSAFSRRMARRFSVRDSALLGKKSLFPKYVSIFTHKITACNLRKWLIYWVLHSFHRLFHVVMSTQKPSKKSGNCRCSGGPPAEWFWEVILCLPDTAVRAE